MFVELAWAAGFETRIYFLESAKGSSPHTVALVLLNGEWILIDSLAGRVLEADGNPLTIEALRQHPELLEEAYEGARSHLAVTTDDFLRGRTPYGDTKPWRLVPEGPLPWPAFPVGAAESVHAYDEFRQAILAGQWARSEVLYAELGRMSLPVELAQGAAYHSTLAAFEAGRWERVLARTHEAVTSDPDTPWRKSLFELSGLANERLGKVAAVLEAYAAADLPSTRVRAQRLMGAN